MLDLDKYMEISKKVKVLGMELNVKQPTVAMIERVNTIERNLTEENILEKRVEVAEIIVNNNREGVKIEKKQLKELSRSALELLIAVTQESLRKQIRNPTKNSHFQRVVETHIADKYFKSEEWEKTYTLKTGILRRIQRYSGLNFKEILDLPYSFFLLLNRESWIESWRTPQGAEFLKDLWRLQQTKADLEAVRRHEGRE